MTECLKVWLFAYTVAFTASALAASGTWDADVSDFPRAAGEIGDSGRIMRAVAAAGQGGVVWFPRGDYAIDERLVISNQVSLLLHKSACLKAVRQMPFVLTYVGRQMEDGGHSGAVVDHNLFIRGGVFDGNGCAGGVQAMGLRHFTLADSTYRNARGVGLQLGDPALPNTAAGGYEVVANNLYFVCTRPGLAGNIGLLTYIGDSHFTDIVVVDHTVGICDRRWSNRFTRCHVWGGPVCNPATKRPEYLPGSIAFDLHGYDAVLDNCYADTAMTGFNVCTMVRLVNCASHNNWRFRMDGPTVINHQKGLLIVTGGRFDKTSPRATPYRRGADAGDRVWRDNTLECFEPADMRELEDALKKQSVGRVSPASGPLADAPVAPTGSATGVPRAVIDQTENRRNEKHRDS